MFWNRVSVESLKYIFAMSKTDYSKIKTIVELQRTWQQFKQRDDTLDKLTKRINSLENAVSITNRIEHSSAKGINKPDWRKNVTTLISSQLISINETHKKDIFRKQYKIHADGLTNTLVKMTRLSVQLDSNLWVKLTPVIESI